MAAASAALCISRRNSVILPKSTANEPDPIARTAKIAL